MNLSPPESTRVDPNQKAITLVEALAEFTTQRLNPMLESTRACYETALLSFMAFMADKSVEATDYRSWFNGMVQLIEGWIESMKGYLAPGTASMYVTKVNYFFKWCTSKGYITQNPFASITKQPVPTKEREILTDKDYARLLAAAGRTPGRLAIIIAMNTGLSFCDVALLKWSDVDLENCVITKIRKKMKRHGEAAKCIIPFAKGGELDVALREAKKCSYGRPYVNPYLGGRHEHNRATALIWANSFFKKAKLKGKSFHNLRHTFTSKLANGGGNLAVIGKITGHRDMRSLQRYIHPDLAAMREVVRVGLKGNDSRQVPMVNVSESALATGPGEENP